MYFFIEKQLQGRWLSCDTWKEDQFYSGCFYCIDEHQFCKKINKETIDLLTGITGKINPIKPLAGIPRDVSLPLQLIVDYEKKRGGGYSKNHTWYNLFELNDFFNNKNHSQKTKNYIQKHCQYFIKIVLPMLKKIYNEKSTEGVRIVIWFDKN